MQIKRVTLFYFSIAIVALLAFMLCIRESLIDDALLVIVALIISLMVLFTVVSVVIGHKLPNSDPYILPLIILLNGIGLLQILRIDYSMSQIYDDYRFAAVNQAIFSALGIIAFLLIIILINSDVILRGLTWTSMCLGIVLLILPLVPGLGLEANGAGVWIKIGPLGTAQPAEFAKICFIIFFSGYLTVNRERLQSAGKKIVALQLPRIQDLGPIIIVWLVSLCVLIFQHDLGTSLLFFALFIVMLFISTGKISWTVIGLLLFSVGAFLCYEVFPHISARVNAWIDPFNPDVYNRAYNGSGQIVQGFFALASGGLFGKGIGNGYPLLTPFSNSDFIYTSLGEEFGLTGLIAILLVYLLLADRAFSISLKIRDKFGKMMACGIGFALCIQIFVVVGGVTGIIPVTGLTLPFIARGGSSLLANYIMFALLQLVSNRCTSKNELFTMGSNALSGRVSPPKTVIVGSHG